MKSPEVARALPSMVAEGLLTPEQAAPLLAAARGDVVSVRGELRALLGLAVTALTAGVGMWIVVYRERLGPLAIAVLLGLAAAAVLVVLARRSPPFTWARAEGRDWTIDGLTLLAVGLVGAEIAWIETQFAALGPSWGHHLLLMSLVTGALATRFDSIPTWTLALATFAAWRGVALMPSTAGQLERTLFGREDRLRVEFLVCGALFLVLARVAERLDRKRHFEPATTLLAFVAAALGLVTGFGESGSWPLWALALGALGLITAVWAFRRRRRGLLALGALAVYVPVTRFLFEVPGAMYFGCFWFLASAVAAIVLLFLVHRHFQRTEPK
jgi:hypothetical protein